MDTTGRRGRSSRSLAAVKDEPFAEGEEVVES
jgi:hypothetical protein